MDKRGEKRKPLPDEEPMNNRAKRIRTTEDGDYKLTAEVFYNSQQNKSSQERTNSSIIHLKNYHNWIKSIMINKYCPEGSIVLDIGCGKGGDLGKWAKAKIRYVVMADIAGKSLDDAQQRLAGGSYKFLTCFIHADCSKEILSKVLHPDTYYDLVSCQFSLHYSFGTETRARTILQNITEKLSPGGMFIGTIPNSNFIVKKLRAEKQKLLDANQSLPEIIQFGNQHFTVKFNVEQHKKLAGVEKDSDVFEKFPAFGAEYEFTLSDSVGGVPEFLVDFGLLVALAGQYDLELVGKRGFHDVWVVENHRYKNLAITMRAFDENHLILSTNEWEVAELYIEFVFKKLGNPNKKHVIQDDSLLTIGRHDLKSSPEQ